MGGLSMETDKLLHLLCGYVIAISVGIWLPWAGVVAGVLAAFGKELVWDKWFGKGAFEWQDINATLVGVLAGFCMAFLKWSV